MGITIMWALDTLCYALPCRSYALFIAFGGEENKPSLTKK